MGDEVTMTRFLKSTQHENKIDTTNAHAVVRDNVWDWRKNERAKANEGRKGTGNL